MHACVCLCVYIKMGVSRKQIGTSKMGQTGGKRWNKGVNKSDGEGGGGIKYFNYEENTISLFLTRDFMVWANVWQKQLRATNAKELHSKGARSTGPF